MPSKQTQKDRVTLVVPEQLLTRFRNAARAELGALHHRNGGNAAVPRVLRRLILEYVELFERKQATGGEAVDATGTGAR